MIALNLETKTPEENILKDYLENNVSGTLAAKINNGVSIEKDGKTLINRKTLDNFLSYACEEARKLADKGDRSACVQDKTVFGWAMHYFEEDSIEGTIYNEDGTEYKPPKSNHQPKSAAQVVKPKQKSVEQSTMFDLFNLQTGELKESAVKTETSVCKEKSVTEPILYETSDGQIQEVIKNEKTDQYEAIDMSTGEILTEEEMREFDGDIYEPKELLINFSNTKSFDAAPQNIVDNNIFNKLSEMLGNILIAR